VSFTAPATITAPKRLMLVAYAFPPVGGVGVQRALKFVKYLPKHGWKTTVLTAANPSAPLRDEKLCDDIPRGTNIVTARTWEPSYEFKKTMSASTQTQKSLLTGIKSSMSNIVRMGVNMVLQPDMQVLWNRNAIAAGWKELQKTQHDAIMVTAPPFSSFLVGVELAKRSGLPLILDYRDEWGISNQYWENKRPDMISRWRQEQMEKHILKHAKLVLATTPSSAQSLQNTISRLPKQPRVAYIYNGFDPEDFRLPVELSTRKDYGNGTKMYRLSYAGTLWNLNRVEPLVEAVLALCAQSPVLAENLELVFAGRKTAPQEAQLDRLQNLPCKVVRLPFVEHQEALRLMKTSDGLVLLNSNVPHADRIVSGKAFEYIAAEKSVFIVSPKGDMWDLFNDCPYAYGCPPNDTGRMTDLLALEIERFRLQMECIPGNWNPQLHTRESRARQLASHLDLQVSMHTGIRKR
jgi:glycosyltransferase involved in cell wall biosynthesis